MRMSQAKRKTRCSGGDHRSDVWCKGRKKKEGTIDARSGLQGCEATSHATILMDKLVDTSGKSWRTRHGMFAGAVEHSYMHYLVRF